MSLNWAFPDGFMMTTLMFWGKDHRGKMLFASLEAVGPVRGESREPLVHCRQVLEGGLLSFLLPAVRYEVLLNNVLLYRRLKTTGP